MPTELGLYRVCMELINNTLKHAEAKNIRIQLMQHLTSIVFSYSDDGKGLPETYTEGHGFKNIEARVNIMGGTITMENNRSGGFHASLTVPVSVVLSLTQYLINLFLNMEQKIYVGLVEDHILFRQGMKAILSIWPEMEVVFESAEGYTVIDKLKASQLLPNVMLVDLSLPPQGQNELSGKEVTGALRETFPDMRIIILSGHEDENFIAQLIEHGAHGYLVKDSDPREVREAIVSVHHKGSYINARTLKAIQNNIGKRMKVKSISSTTEQLTRREEEILDLICQQFTTEEIAERLFISPKTVNGHRNSLLEKTGSHNVAGLVIYAIRNNIIMIS